MVLFVVWLGPVAGDWTSSCADENGVCAIAACGTSVEGTCDEYGLLLLDRKSRKYVKSIFENFGKYAI